MSLKEQIFAFDDLPRKQVTAWGVTFFLRTISGAERDGFELAMNPDGKSRNLGNLRARLVALCAVDENGNRIFDDADIARLGKKSAMILDDLFEQARELNGMTTDAVEKAEKNSEPTPAGAST